jgi:hypothetical protein
LVLKDSSTALYERGALSEATRSASFLGDNDCGSGFIVSDESSVSRSIELESPTPRAVCVCEIADGLFTLLSIFFSSEARETSCSVDVNGGESRRNRVEGQREDEGL